MSKATLPAEGNPSCRKRPFLSEVTFRRRRPIPQECKGIDYTWGSVVEQGVFCEGTADGGRRKPLSVICLLSTVCRVGAPGGPVSFDDDANIDIGFGAVGTAALIARRRATQGGDARCPGTPVDTGSSRPTRSGPSTHWKDLRHSRNEDRKSRSPRLADPPTSPGARRSCPATPGTAPESSRRKSSTGGRCRPSVATIPSA